MGMYYVSKVDLVYQVMRREILAGKRRPGERLLAQNIAVQLGTSVGPVRESLRRLEAEGLVTIQPHVGATVAPSILDGVLNNLDDVWQSILMLSVLSGLAARLAADCEKGVSTEQLVTLEQLVSAMDEAPTRGGLDEFHRLSIKFHKVIYAAARARRVTNVIENLLQTVHIGSRDLRHLEEDVAQSTVEHRMILEALKQHKPAAAEACMREHIEAVGRRGIDRLRRRQDGKLDGLVG